MGVRVGRCELSTLHKGETRGRPTCRYCEGGIGSERPPKPCVGIKPDRSIKIVCKTTSASNLAGGDQAGRKGRNTVPQYSRRTASLAGAREAVQKIALIAADQDERRRRRHD